MRTTAPLLLLLAACADVEDPDHDHEGEVITTVTLTFTPDAGDALSFTWTDPEDDGDPQIDEVVLPADGAWTLTVAFANALEDPPEDITPEVADEAEEHQVFYTGDGVVGPATGTPAGAILSHAYADADAGGLPIGLENDVSALAAGTGTLVVTLRHLPEEGGEPVKVAGLAEDVSADGFGAIGGENDAQVTFPLTVE